MGRSTNETEVKLPFESGDAAREVLSRLGATVTRPRHFEDNIVYDREHDPLKPAGKLLRLRRAGGRAVLTYKAPVPGEHRHKVRVEHESTVEDGDAMARVFEGLGFRSIYRYQKYRTVFALGELEVSLDETPLGCFVELEGAPEAIDRAASSMGFTPDRYVLKTYRELQEEAVGEDGGDLLLDPGGKGASR